MRKRKTKWTVRILSVMLCLCMLSTLAGVAIPSFAGGSSASSDTASEPEAALDAAASDAERSVPESQPALEISANPELSQDSADSVISQDPGKTENPQTTPPRFGSDAGRNARAGGFQRV